MNSDPPQSVAGRLAGTTANFRKLDWLFAFLLVTLTFLVYQPVWRGSPIWDDGEHITNAEFASLNGLRRIWFEPGATAQYHPLLDTAFWIQQKLWGGSTLGYHLFSIACHAAGALLVLASLRRLEVKGAWVAAAIFALHPVHVESVAWISELKNTMMGAFSLAAMLVYLRFDETRKWSWYILSVGLFLCALLSKATAIVWPVGMLIVLWWNHGGLAWKRDVLPLVPLLPLAMLDGWVTMRVEHSLLAAPDTQLQFTLPQRFLIAGRACWFYLGKLLWPVGLCPIYPRWPIDHASAPGFLYPIGVLVLLAGLWALRKWNRAPLAATLFFVVTLSPPPGLVTFSYLRYSFVADHFQYLASLGVIALVAGGGAWLLDRRRLLPRPAVIVLCLAILAALAGRTWQYSRTFTNLETFARTTLSRNPDCWAAHDHLGLILTSQGKLPEAIDQYHQALQGNPRYAMGHFNLGCALAAQGKLDDAIQQYEQAVQLQPDLVRAYYNLGCTLASQRKYSQAIEQYQQALRLKPNDPEVHNNLGVALASSGKLDEAIRHFREALRLRPDFAKVQSNLDLALNAREKQRETQTGRSDETSRPAGPAIP